MRVVNLSHGEFIVLSAFLGVSLVRVVPWLHPLALLLPVAVIAFCLGFGLQAVLINRVVTRPDPFAGILLTFGVAVVMRNLMVEIYGADPRHLQAGHLAQASAGFGGLHVGVLPLLILALSVALFTALQLVLTRTRFGRIVRATADHRDVVRLMGVNPGRVYNVVMGLAGPSYSVKQLAEAGVKPVSLGSALSRAALGGFVRAAREIRDKGTFSFTDEAMPFAEANAYMGNAPG